MVRNASSLVRHSGFTLIELLTVISIIAILAGITLGLTAAAKRARINARGEAELQQLRTAIEAYKADRNAYPPDHVLPPGSAAKVDPVVNPLYYELVGMNLVNGNFVPRGQNAGGGTGLSSAQVKAAFGRGGFLNASADPSEPSKTYFSPKASGVGRVTVGGGVEVQLLITPFEWPTAAPTPAPIAGVRLNPWRYVSTSPTNNPGGFDLWVELYVGREKRVFKNWN